VPDQLALLPVKQILIIHNKNNEILLIQDQFNNMVPPSSFICKTEYWDTNIKQMLSKIGISNPINPSVFDINLPQKSCYRVFFNCRLPKNVSIQINHCWKDIKQLKKAPPHNSYNQSNRLMTYVTQAAVIQNTYNQILILSLPDGEWHFPGGRINNGESWENSIRREVQEETTITNFSILSILGVENWILRSSKKPCYAVFFLCSTDKFCNIRLSHEHIDFAWIDKHTDLSQFDFYHPCMKKIIEDLLSKEIQTKGLQATSI